METNENKCIFELDVMSSMCDLNMQMGVSNCADLCMDAATIHANILNVGQPFLLKSGFYWLAVKSRFKMFRLPGMNEHIKMITFAEPPVRIRSDRNYKILSGDEVLVLGKTEWVIADIKTQKMQPMNRFYNDEQSCSESVWDEPFSRIRDMFLDEPYYEYTVSTTDIDMGHHMNNVAYIRALGDSLNTKIWNSNSVSELEIIYRNPSHEGDKLLFYKKEGEGFTDFKLAHSDGTTVILARVTFR